MIILRGKNEENVDRAFIESLNSSFDRVVVDIGTGDGKNVYRKAKADGSTLYIGIDPVKSNMQETSTKLLKKPEKGGLKNVLLVIAAYEKLPDELCGIADSVTVLFPWGSLLEGVVKPVDAFLDAVRFLSKPGASFEFITTYGEAFEENTIETRELPSLSEEYLKGEYSEKLLIAGLTVTEITKHGNDYVKSFDSAWARRLAFGRKRDFYRIYGTIK